MNGIFKGFGIVCHIKTSQMICRPKETLICKYSLSSKIQIVNCVFVGKKYRRANKIGKQKEVDFSDGCQQRTKTLKKGVNSFINENFTFSLERCPTYLIFQLLLLSKTSSFLSKDVPRILSFDFYNFCKGYLTLGIQMI